MDTLKGMALQVQLLERAELLAAVRDWQRELWGLTPKQEAAMQALTNGQLQARVLRIQAHKGLDAAGRLRVNQELEQQGILRWVGTVRKGYWELAS